MKKLCLILLWLGSQVAQAAIVGEEIRYEINGDSHVGYLSYDTVQTTPRPGVLIVHEWWGHNAYARQRAHMLAAAGYVALALDMYGGGRHTVIPGEAKAMMQMAMSEPGAVAQRFEAARQLLAGNERVDEGRIAAMGYCFGGGVVLNMARAGSPLRGVISFHGSLTPQLPIDPALKHPPMLVFNGEADPFVPPEQVRAFKDEMDLAGVALQYIGYPGVKHSFTNPGADLIGRKHGLPLQYDARADADSWDKALDFLAQIFWQQPQALR